MRRGRWPGAIPNQRPLPYQQPLPSAPCYPFKAKKLVLFSWNVRTRSGYLAASFKYTAVAWVYLMPVLASNAFLNCEDFCGVVVRTLIKSSSSLGTCLYTLVPFGCSCSFTGVGCGVTSTDRKSTRLNSSHPSISYAVFCL